eukprot:362054-Chlamydomonas_euryale.AAC.1
MHAQDAMHAAATPPPAPAAEPLVGGQPTTWFTGPATMGQRCAAGADVECNEWLWPWPWSVAKPIYEMKLNLMMKTTNVAEQEQACKEDQRQAFGLASFEQWLDIVAMLLLIFIVLRRVVIPSAWRNAEGAIGFFFSWLAPTTQAYPQGSAPLHQDDAKPSHAFRQHTSKQASLVV